MVACVVLGIRDTGYRIRDVPGLVFSLVFAAVGGLDQGQPLLLPVFGLTSTDGEEPCGSSDSSAGAVRPRPLIPGR